jgi:flagellar protein FliT
MQSPHHTDPTLTAGYQQLESTSRQMLAAAQRQDWRTVKQLELSAQRQVADLQHPPAPLSPAERQARQRVLLAVLRHDAQVRALADPAVHRITHGRPQLH